MSAVNPLAKLSAATTALAESSNLEEVKQILSIAEAARTYARAAKLGLEAQNHAAELKLRAERKAGELLAQLERGIPKPYSSLENGSSEYKEVLTENDIPPVTAHRWQTEATIPEELFEEHIAEVKAEQKELTSAGLLRLANELKEASESVNHEWTDSELTRRGYVENSGAAVIANMKTDLALIAWAKSEGVFERIDRATEWGNPFLLPGDGDRQTVVENYQIYLDLKPSLLTKIDTLKGKVLGCWCYPELCHGEVLEDYANDTAD